MSELVKHLISDKYTVEKLTGDESHEGNYRYKISSKRATYFLMRTEKNKHLMFALNNSMRTTQIDGSSWWSDATGVLRPVSGAGFIC